MFIGLLLRAMKNDLNLKRVAAFAKRLLQVNTKLHTYINAHNSYIHTLTHIFDFIIQVFTAQDIVQVSLQQPPQYACACIFLLSEVLKSRPPLWSGPLFF